MLIPSLWNAFDSVLFYPNVLGAILQYHDSLCLYHHCEMYLTASYSILMFWEPFYNTMIVYAYTIIVKNIWQCLILS